MKEVEACINMTFTYHPSGRNDLGIRKEPSCGYRCFWFNFQLTFEFKLASFDLFKGILLSSFYETLKMI